MKSYTSIEQVKKLVEFLSLESADGFYAENVIITEPFITYLNGERNIPAYKGAIPCWSLAALLDVFPNSEQKSVDICNGGWKGEEYVSDWFCSYDDYEKNYFETTNSDNPIDACYEMIIKLHEKNLL